MIVFTARCDDAGGLMLEGMGACECCEVFERLRHFDAVPDSFNFANCDFGPGARDRLEQLRAQNVPFDRYFGPFATVLDPEGGQHVCQELSEEYAGQGPRFWCAGYVRASVDAVIDAPWDAWDKPCDWDDSYARAERSFTERFEP